MKSVIDRNEKIGDILESQDKRIKALEVTLNGLMKIILVYTGVKSILKALKKNDE